MTGRERASTLPPLTAQQAAHAQRVLQSLRELIAARGGWLRFDEYLQQVMYAPGLGYYSAGSAKFGEAGDFVTAPELSELFGRCVARQCAQVLGEVGGSVLEFGAGTGALAADVLQQLQQLQCLPQSYWILEISAQLRARQQARLAELPEELRRRVHWLDALPAEPIEGVVLANEVADALPFRRFVFDDAGVWEDGVALSDGGELTDSSRPAPPDLRTEIDRLRDGLAWPHPYQSELCELLTPWVASLGAAMSRGAVLIIDYGLPRHEYYHPQRDHGTLRCHYRHRAHDNALLFPGLQDITAWVDFTRVAEAADAARLEVAGYCTQAAFLLACGLEADVAAESDPVRHARLASQARQLLMPDAMGETFKVMALTRGLQQPLRGFALQDLRRAL